MRSLLWIGLCGCLSLQAGSVVAWIGTSGPIEEAKGIYRTELDTETGQLRAATLAAEVGRPGFLALHPNGEILYAACQLPDGGGGGIAAYQISNDQANLTLLNMKPIGDGGAAHLTVDQTGKLLFSAQYGGGSVAVFPLANSGALKDRAQLIEHEGSGPNAARQKAPHPHWVGTGPGNDYLFVPDLGIDRVVVYRIDHSSGRLVRHGEGICPSGGGPRHFKFHPNGKWAYVLNELILAVTVFNYDSAAGALTPVQTIPSLPKQYWQGFNSCSEIRVHPSGRFLYTANRGHDSVTVFRVDQETGRLSFVEREAIRGAMPRNFGLDPSGRWLVAAGLESHSLTSFAVDQDLGSLLYTRYRTDCPRPMCVLFGSHLD